MHEDIHDNGQQMQLKLLIAEVTRSFFDVSPSDIDAKINDALAACGSFVGADRSYVFLSTGSFMSNSHEWCDEGIEPQIDSLQNLPIIAFQWTMDQLLDEGVVVIPDVALLGPEAAAEKETLQAQAIQSVIMVRMETTHGRDLGFLGFDAVRNRRQWTHENATLLKVIGTIIATMLERIQLYKQLRSREKSLQDLTNRLVEVEDSQRRMYAEQIHEGIGQDLALVRLHLLQLAEKSGSDWHVKMQPSLELIDGVIAWTRDLTFELSPASLFELGLAPALSELAHRSIRQTGISTTFTEQGDPCPLELESKQVLFRAAKELITNAYKHARPGNVAIRLDWKESEIELSVEDDGCGFSESKDHQGIGLAILREQVQDKNGRLTIEEGEGGKVTVVLPVRNNHLEAHGQEERP